MNRSSELCSVTEVIAMACRLYGRKRGWCQAARLLGVTERWVKAAAYGEPIAPPGAVIVESARIELARARAAQLRAELAQIEGLLDGETVDAHGAHMGPAR
jgi:hypothetical protein